MEYLCVHYVGVDGQMEKNLKEMEGWNARCKFIPTNNYSIQWWAPDKFGSSASSGRPKPVSGPTCLTNPIINSRSKENGYCLKRVTRSFSNLRDFQFTNSDILPRLSDFISNRICL